MIVRAPPMAYHGHPELPGGMPTTPDVTARRVAVAALFVVGLSLVLLKLLGQSMPAVPPGLVLVLAAAVAMLATSRRWAAVLGVLAGAAEALGVLLGSGLFTLGDGSSDLAIMIVTWLRLVASLVAVVACLRCLVAGRRGLPDVDAEQAAR